MRLLALDSQVGLLDKPLNLVKTRDRAVGEEGKLTNALLVLQGS